MKKLFSLALLSVFSYAAYAQNQANMDASANQTVNLLLSNAIDVTFTANGSTTGPLVEIPFTTINDYVNGVETSSQQLKVRSNKAFQVTVKTNAEHFTYSGIASPTPTMPVSDVLLLKVVANFTGGSIESPFSGASYATIRHFNQILLSGCSAGADQTFDVKYKANPGFAYPAGTYIVDVIYTATQQ